MLSIIYTFRNRDIQRVKASLDSLEKQTTKSFRVFFIDYGSNQEVRVQVNDLCKTYKFVTYTFIPTHFQPWNKSKALNSVIKNNDSKFCFVADIDMVFHFDFVKVVEGLQGKNKCTYFQVGFLSRDHGPVKSDDWHKSLYRKSTEEATGLCLFPLSILKELRGFDEFYHFWGAEDTDIHVRLKNAGYEVAFYDKQVLMVHQWHPSYRSTETGKLTQDLKITRIVQLNHQHLKHAHKFKTTIVNPGAWGECLSIKQLEELENAPVNLLLDNEKIKIDHLLYGILPNLKNQVLKIFISTSRVNLSFEYRIKKLVGKKVSEYYSLKEINDKILIHIISFYRNNAYTYKISEDLNSIEISLKL